MEKINLSVQRSFSDLITVTINFKIGRASCRERV